MFGSDYVDEGQASSFTGTGRVASLLTTTTLMFGLAMYFLRARLPDLLTFGALVVLLYLSVRY